MSQHVVDAGAREIGTKGALNDLRKNGGIPAVVYNRHGKVTPIVLNEKAFKKAVDGVSESTIIKLNVGSDSFDCLVKDRQLDWLHGTILHVDFFEVESGVIMRAKVPVHLTGSSIGVRNGGILENPVHDIEVECFPAVMPEKFMIDISELEANHSIHVRDIIHAEGVKILSAPDQVVVLVKFAKAEEVAEETVEAAAAVPGTPAVAGAAPVAGAAAGASPAAAGAAPAAPGKPAKPGK
ncbi:MAG: 50S ribosomal protein L25 [Spirochaetae bacterium HGW-Spirochaetae-7]|jgi:large subunit ribosomal protein L25|nr:MAG: 50S ribosomal protein L25 [Spirochaetae bacterium HGW-Spirochaetae-7]